MTSAKTKAMHTYEKLYIGGELVPPAGTGVIEVRSPATGELIGRAPEGTEADIDRAVAAARQAFDHGPWPRQSKNERADALARLNEQIMLRQEELAQVITAEVGSPITFSRTAQALAPLDGAELLRRPRPHLPLRRATRRSHQQGVGPARARGGRRRDHPLERPALRARSSRSPPPSPRAAPSS